MRRSWATTRQGLPRALSFCGSSGRIEAKQPIEVLWGMVTASEVKLDGRVATLGGKVRAEIVSPADARFDFVSTQPPAPQNPNQGTRKLAVRLPEKATRVKITVKLSR